MAPKCKHSEEFSFDLNDAVGPGTWVRVRTDARNNRERKRRQFYSGSCEMILLLLCFFLLPLDSNSQFLITSYKKVSLIHRRMHVIESEKLSKEDNQVKLFLIRSFD